jgi:hypothetical protein
MGEPSDFDGMTVEVSVTSPKDATQERTVSSVVRDSELLLANPESAR